MVIVVEVMEGMTGGVGVVVEVVLVERLTVGVGGGGVSGGGRGVIARLLQEA